MILRQINMHHFILGLSFIFFSLSGLFTFKAFQNPGNKFREQNSQQSVKLANPIAVPAENLDKFTKGQKDNRVIIEEPQIPAPSEGDKFAKNATQGKMSENPGTTVLLFRGVFPPGQEGINKNLMKSVIELVPRILASPDHQVIIEGHTDNEPIRASKDKFKDNIELSYFRAYALARALERNGVPYERMTVIGYGGANPIASNETEEGKIKNRRVEVKLISHDLEF